MSLHAAAVGPSVLPDLREQVEQIIAEARRQGASACEVAVSLEQGLSTSVRQGEVETVEFNRDQGFGITSTQASARARRAPRRPARRPSARRWRRRWRSPAIPPRTNAPVSPMPR